MNFVGTGQPLTRRGLSAALEQLELGPNDAAYIWTIVEVETSGTTQGYGFRPDRRPQVLFERHKFREFTGGRFNSEAPDVSGPRGGYGKLSWQYGRLQKALELCRREVLGEEPALKSASWGLGQVMGFNHALAGFQSAKDMVEAMQTGENAQLAAMAGFIVENGLANKLARKDWVAFAKTYNGKDYADNHYDVKLDVQYERFASGSLPNLEVRAAQAALALLGYSPGKIDGVIGPRTRSALRSFRVAAGLPAGDGLDGEVYSKLCERAGINPDLTA